VIRTGGGTFDPTDRSIYFLAGYLKDLMQASQVHPYLLSAVNEFSGPTFESQIEAILDRGVKLFIDSGVFILAAEHARRHNISVSEAIATSPEHLDGFDQLWARYVSTIERFSDRVWGYVELDAGGRENKIKTRAKLEAMGFRPIPVYHPLSDGWDYFDELAENYDRICIGNLVGADDYMRARIVATVWERHRKYPTLWIHLLGFTPNETLNAWPVDSADSSTWLAGRRWDGINERADGHPFSRLEKNLQYVLGSDADSDVGYLESDLISAYQATCQQRNWRAHLAEWSALGCDLYPEVQ
jgi:hypothetical protein